MLTPSQIDALDTKQNLSVIANAGAGKTTVLIQRFIKILTETSTQVKEIAAITFTEKAANELKNKIAEEVKKLMSVAEDDAVRRRWALVRDQLTSANIGTIHSFCAQLLREYPVEAEVDASFSILNNFDQNAFEKEAIRGALVGILTDMENSEKKEKIHALLRYLDRRTVENYCQKFLKKRELIDRLCKLYDFSLPEKVQESLRNNLIEHINQYLSNSNWNDILDKILSYSNKPSFRAKQEELKYWEKISSKIQRIELFQNITDDLFTKDLNLRVAFSKTLSDVKIIQDEIYQLKHIREYVEAADFLVADQKGEEGNEILYEMIEPLLTIFREVLQRYEEKKNEYAFLDFEDILLKTRGLLQNPEVIKSISSKFKYILVDEFQDTNLLQYDIIHSLTLAKSYSNLFIVGDAKQSIYGFRDAEVEVFEKANAEINRFDQGKSIVLGESFRLLPALIDFVNRVFSKIMTRSHIDFGVRYDDLIQGRNNKADGSVELILLPVNNESENKSDENIDLITMECRLIAEQIIELVNDKKVIYRGREEIPGNFEFRDAAILLRNRDYLQVLEKTLTEFNIPFILTGGIGYFQTQEILDIVNYLKFLLNPDDDVALAGILRSPFFTLSDAELFCVSQEKGSSFWHKLLKCINKNERIKEIIALLLNHLDIAKRLPIPDLIQKIIVDTGWVGVMSGLPMGEECILNIEKLIGIAREFEERGLPSLYDFAQRLVDYIETEEREGQAPRDIKENCVRIMTIHAAKGLEFGVVFLPFLHRGIRYDTSPFIDPEYGVAFPVRETEDADNKIDPGILKFLKIRQKRRVEAEEMRIFYVACTRARDMLILSAQNKIDKTSYLKWIVESLNISEQINSSRVINLGEKPMKILDRTKNSVIDGSHNLEIQIRVERPSGEIVMWKGEMKPEEHQEKEYQIEKIVGTVKGEFYSATQILTYLECPQKYYLKYLLGIPEYSPPPYGFSEEEDSNDALRGDVEGSLIHMILQFLNDDNISDEKIIKEIEQSIIRSPSPLWGKTEEYIKMLKKPVSDFVNSPIGKWIFGCKEYLSEYKLNLALDDYFLTGTIDRLFKDENNLWNIVDYKTDRIDVQEIKERSEKYLPQIKFYSLLVHEYFRQEKIPATIIFIRHPENPVSLIFDKSQIADFKITVRDVIKKINLRIFDPNPDFCKNCAFTRKGKCIMPEN